MQGGISKNDNLDSLTICDVISSNSRKKPYRITKVDKFELFEQRELTRHHHNLKEELNVYTNRLQKCIDIVFPEFNSLLILNMALFILMYLNHLVVPLILLMQISELFANVSTTKVKDCVFL